MSQVLRGGRRRLGRDPDRRLRRGAVPLLVTGALSLRADLGVSVDALGVRGHAQAVLVADLDADVAADAGQVLDRPVALLAGDGDRGRRAASRAEHAVVARLHVELDRPAGALEPRADLVWVAPRGRLGE